MTKKSDSGTACTGKVKFYNVAKGYGFITNVTDSKDYFFHFTGLVDQVKQDEQVTFTLVDGERGIKAVNIQLINSSHI